MDTRRQMYHRVGGRVRGKWFRLIDLHRSLLNICLPRLSVYYILLYKCLCGTVLGIPRGNGVRSLLHIPSSTWSSSSDLFRPSAIKKHIIHNNYLQNIILKVNIVLSVFFCTTLFFPKNIIEFNFVVFVQLYFWSKIYAVVIARFLNRKLYNFIFLLHKRGI